MLSFKIDLAKKLKSAVLNKRSRTEKLLPFDFLIFV